MTLGSAALVAAALFLGVPGLFVGARGLSGLRRGVVMVRGRPVEGPSARAAAALLVAYGAAMIGLAALVLAVAALRGRG